MIRLRHGSAILALSLMASMAFGAGETSVETPKSTESPSGTAPGASCPLTCKVVRVSTRCECPMGKSPVNTTV